MRQLILLVIGLLFLVSAGCSGEGRAQLVEEDSSAVADALGDVTGTTDTSAGETSEPGKDGICVPDCNGRECGDDGCGGSCGKCPQAAPLCGENGFCEIECIPDCESAEKECGDDGCGGACGSCPQIAPYCVDHKCAVDCTPDCTDALCGDDGCGGSCGECPGANEKCQDGSCVCQPNCAGKACGSDGCGGSCGDCPDDTPFCQGGKCINECEPECGDAECGDDGCGGNCGECDGNDSCLDGQCICQPDCPPGSCGGDGCGGKCDGCACDEQCQNDTCKFIGCADQECGKNGCGESCGTCPAGSKCLAELCIDACEASCQGKECGPDGCGGWCGSCNDGLICTDFGQCVGQCTPDCQDVECGPNGCGGSCGICAFMPGALCQNGKCTLECDPGCDGKVCGSDGCDGSCGNCKDPMLCTVAGTCGGYCAQCTFHADCYDIDFGNGSLGNWSINASNLITKLGETTAPTGGYMLKLTTGEGLTEFSSAASFQNCLPAGSYMMLVKWRLYSEEFKEWCGSNFQDSFSVEVTTGDISEIVAAHDIDDLCDPAECAGCGDTFIGLEKSDVDFDQGDVWNTPWHEDWLPITLPDAQSLFTLTLTLEDAGDGIYDSVLLVDRIRFVPCNQACEFVECGVNPCGEECGQCAADGVCQEGTCCYPDCGGKECGSDGCGGTCGQCGNLTACSNSGACECKFDECADGCCFASEVCAAISGKCCEPVCAGAPCASDGCGGKCPGPNGQECCSNAGDCDDGDDLCTDDLCTNGICSNVPTGNPACCQAFSWKRDFDTGNPQGFTIANSGGGGFPGMEAGWSVSDVCGSHSAPFSLYFGMTGGLLGQCLYSIGFPGLGGFSGTATSPTIALPATPPTLTFWYMADILPAEPTEKLSLSIVQSGVSSTVWSKANNLVIGPEWHKATVPLLQYTGKSVKLLFDFETAGTQQSGGKGVLIDDIAITAACAP